MIKPTVGRVVWFFPAAEEKYRPANFVYHDFKEPLAAHIAHVWNDRLVNLMVIDSNGVAHSCTSVQLLQDDDAKPELGYFAFWMPYQKGQAAKTEALEQKISGQA